MGYGETCIAYGSFSCALEFSSEVRGRCLKSTSFCPQSSSKLTQPKIKDRRVCNYKTPKGSVSSGLGFSSDVRKRSLKVNPFWPQYSSKVTEPIIQNDMMFHYKRIITAKSAIDTSVPESYVCFVKNKDRIKQNQQRRSRPQSAVSRSQKSRRASCSSAQTNSSVCDADGPDVCLRSSVVSSPRVTTTFHSNEPVYSSPKTNAKRTHPASGKKQGSTEASSQRRKSACSLRASEDQNMYKTFQVPEQTTCSGDLLQKHSHLFTPDQPFTPKLLKSEKSSSLSNYRYYRAPPRTKSKECEQVLDESSQDLTTDHEGSQAELSETFLSSSSQQSRNTNSQDRDFFNDPERASPDDSKASEMGTRSVSAEEEIEYLQFISAVTEDILSRGHISDRVIKQVFQWHLDNNLHNLDEVKVRHLLEVLRQDFDQPTNFYSNEELDKEEDNHLDSLALHLQPGEGQSKAKANNDLFFNGSQEIYQDPSGYGEPQQSSTPSGSPERITSPKIFEREHKEDIISGGSAPSLLNDTDTTGPSDDPTNCFNDEKHEDTNVTLHEEDQADTHSDEQPKELEDLTLTLSHSLLVSCDRETALESTDTVPSSSDDEF
ncbi:spermatogenesis-associated protein 7 homolog isoform X2 [Gouania willdenowi]|uniref:spermatogenesis-associated protein 7 homolog isoform X2 n=1 Tax=Gouania willdenowi TaxID=441366 RepID=UPI001056800D|nr:spermatogenesis-associated protein 7 isoform X2 [Gouania willdenowi]XP_028294135.1 spermatogenesis-associated protein 7 isoform X2 [Gouania willdenowi]